MQLPIRAAAVIFLLASFSAFAQQPTPQPTTAAEAPDRDSGYPDRDSAYIDPQGIAHITRVVPVPATISPEAQKMLSRAIPDQAVTETLAERRAHTDASTAAARLAWSLICPVGIVEDKIAGIPVHIVSPAKISDANRDKVLINLHGGGFNSDSGSYAESIPIAAYSGITVISVLYRLAPEHPFPAGIDDAITIYKELLKTHRPGHIAIYGTSAGAIMTAEVAVKLKQLGLPMPGALGIFSALGDFARPGDSVAIFTGSGLSGHLAPPQPEPRSPDYVGATDPRNPVLSPMYADLSGLPPTLFVSGTRDYLLSGTANLHRAFLRAGVDARLVVFDAMPHAFWYSASLPESIEASHIMADFLLEHVSR
jgi:epsilon-lactone hydrolase